MFIKYNGFKTKRESFSKEEFGQDFKWGVSAAAFQTEGSPVADGKGASIWDIFSAKKGNIFKNQTADVACDFYNRYKEDIDLLKEMNIPNFRFSLSWPRIIPDGTGSINQQGIDFYNQVIEYCLKNDIEPWITLYHWDLPQELEKKGGWTNREILNWFAEYVEVCAKAFGDRVKNWMVLNEPMVFTGAGYFLGIHAPGRKGLKNFIPAMHHAALCQSIGGRILRKEVENGHIGTTFSCSPIQPYRKNKKDEQAAVRVDALINRLFLEPCLGMGYPTEKLPFLKRREKYLYPEDDELLRFDFDFIGLQNYTREVVKHTWFVPYLRAINIKPSKRNVRVTSMNWEVYPEGIYQMLKKFSTYKEVRKIYVTENGAAFPDQLENGEVHDPARLEFLQSYLKQVLRAQKEGIKVEGFFVWSFTDNFEWAEGYHPRFGLVYIDYQNQKRIVKSSGKWLQNFLRSSTRFSVLK